MHYVRFMGYSELEKYLRGETLTNHTVWRNKARCTDSIGFCFFSNMEQPEMRMQYLTGVCDLDCVAEFKYIGKKKLRKTYGRYRDPDRDNLSSLIPTMMEVPEYSIEEYNNRVMLPVRIGVVMDPFYTRKIEWVRDYKMRGKQ